VRNRWLVSCLLAGAVIAVALVSSIPLYTDGILQRMLTRDLEFFQEQMNMFPGRYTILDDLSGRDDPVATFREHDLLVNAQFVPAVGLPVIAKTNKLSVEYLQALPSIPREEKPVPRYMRLDALEGAPDHARIVQGSMFSAQQSDGALEVIVTEQALVSMDLRLGEEYGVSDMGARLAAPLRMRVVGVYTVREAGDPWWYLSLRNYEDSALMDYGLMRALFVDSGPAALSGSQWSFALDYHAITLANLRRVVAALEGQTKFLEDNSLAYDLPMLDILQGYFGRETTLLSTLLFLQVPVLIMLAFYIYMVSLLIVDAERNEIAVIKSRGAGSAQVFVVYLLESLLLAAAALAAGPPLGLLVCRMIGASNGFMEFVQRAPLPARLGSKAYLYAAGCAGFIGLTMLVPATLASRTTIVLHKQRRSRAGKAPVWKRLFLDLVLLALAGYGWYGYRTRRTLLAFTGLKPGELPLDPLLFLVSAFFVVGVGLLFLRLYPLLVRLLFRLGRGAWPPGPYATFLGVGRSGGQEQFLMLFLILTLSIGILNAKSARTINRNIEDKIRYAVGADITLLEDWPSNKPAPPAPGPSAFPLAQGVGSAPAPAASGIGTQIPVYREPDFGRFTSLRGVQSAARVFRRTGVFVYPAEGTAVKSTILGIRPQEFGKTAWLGTGLLPAHPNRYLNLLAASPRAVLLSQSFADAHKVKLGDEIGITWAGQGYLAGTVYGFVPWWPTYNPYTKETGETTELVIANLSWVRANMALEPYEVWLKNAPGASREEIYAQLAEKEIRILRLSDAGAQVAAAKNDALLQGTNGALTMGFVVTMLVSFIGFLIYWIISIQSRVLQFGVFRAMGLSRLSVAGMLALEQVLISIVAILAGIAIGGAAADLFVPLLELTKSAAEQVPPFQVIADPRDYYKVYVIVAAMLGAGIAALALRVSRIRISQAIKLGEE